MSLKAILTRLAHRGETGLDLFKEALIERLRLDGQPHIRPYIGYGTAEAITVRGRVLRNRPAIPSAEEDAFWENALRTYRFVESDEIPHALVRGSGLGDSRTATADEEGFVTLTLRPQVNMAGEQAWHEIDMELLDPIPAGEDAVVAPVLIPPAGAAFGVISDIDDTILHSSATNLVEAVRLMFLENAATRTPFPGIAPLYRALQRGGEGPGQGNPIFYVSSSPWNLFEMLTDFMTLQEIPRGPLFLKDYGVTAEQLFTSGHGAHKLTQIETLLTTYPGLPFILIGDSGQKDPEIYREAVIRFPGRIATIYIRDVTDDRRDRAVERLAAECARMGVEMVLAADSGRVAAHAAENGFITPAAAGEVVAAVESE